MSDNIFAFGPRIFKKTGNAHDGRSYGFVVDSETARRYGHWSETGSYQTATLDVAEVMSLAHGADIVQNNCAFSVLDDDVLAFGYDTKGPNGGRWINARTLIPVIGKTATALTKRYRDFIEFLSTPQV